MQADRQASPRHPGQTIRAIRKGLGLTLQQISETSGLAVSVLSKLENGRISLSYDKLVAVAKGMNVDTSEILMREGSTVDPAPAVTARRSIQRAGEGRLVETGAYKQLYLAAELLNKRFTPFVVEICATTMAEFEAEFGGMLSHPGEEFVYVLEGELEFFCEHYEPVRLQAGDSMYFDSAMRHAYLRRSSSVCRVLDVCSAAAPRVQIATR